MPLIRAMFDCAAHFKFTYVCTYVKHFTKMFQCFILHVTTSKMLQNVCKIFFANVLAC